MISNGINCAEQIYEYGPFPELSNRLWKIVWFNYLGIINSRIMIFFFDLVSFHWQGQESQDLKKKKKIEAIKYHVPIGTMLLWGMLCVY